MSSETPNHPQVHDVLIIGAGVAGCGVAQAFAKQGRRILVVERSLKEPDRIVGELLQPGGMDALARLGLSECVQDIGATPVEGYHLYWKGEEEATFWFCPPSDSAPSGSRSCGADEAETPSGRSFHHGKFVGKLRRRIAREENITLVEATALEILREARTGAVIGAKCSTGRDGDTINYLAHLTILADGSGSNFRSQFTACRPQAQSRFWGLELLDADLPFHNYAYGVIGSGPPMLMYQISPRETRILIDIPNTVYAEIGGSRGVPAYIRDRVAASVPDSVKPSLRDAVDRGRLRSMPNAWVPSTQNRTPGLVVLGDAANMRHPLTGGGMTVALKDAILLSRLLDPAEIPSLEDSGAVLRRMSTFHWRRKMHAASLNILAQALYLLFVTEGNPRLQIMQTGFVRYIQAGKENFAEPVAIMGGIVENPLRLFYQFVRIAVYSVQIHLRQAGLLGFPRALAQSFLVFVRAVGIILPSILAELKA
ncbi:hypothetical protein ACRALDRAFT_1037401 [Sodiomyces alcalophilus JCM 7366]|uniref:uncharacterized protein n=1 Tax=Sodiomyces alcalophilus JCM 7366 TaxID=591952 RepID=UPI0039B50045